MVKMNFQTQMKIGKNKNKNNNNMKNVMNFEQFNESLSKDLMAGKPLTKQQKDDIINKGIGKAEKKDREEMRKPKCPECNHALSVDDLKKSGSGKITGSSKRHICPHCGENIKVGYWPGFPVVLPDTDKKKKK